MTVLAAIVALVVGLGVVAGNLLAAAQVGEQGQVLVVALAGVLAGAAAAVLVTAVL
jgi:hypothetical protein